MIWCSRLTIISIGKIFRRLLVKSSLEMETNWKPSESEPVRSGVWWSVVPNFNLNHRHKFKLHLNFIFEIKTKSKFTFQVDIQNQIDLFFPLYFVFRLLSWLISHFNSSWYPKPNWFMLSLVFCFSFVVLVDKSF